MSNNVPGIGDEMSEGATLRELVKTVLRYRVLIGIIIGVFLVGTGIYLNNAEPRYEASGQMVMAPSRSSLLTDTISRQYEQYSEMTILLPVNNVITRMRGSGIADSVILKTNAFAVIGLPREQYQKMQYFSAIPPEITREFAVHPAASSETDADYRVLAENGSLVGKGKYNEKFISPHFSMILSDMGSFDKFMVRLEPIRRARARILNDLNVVNIRDSDIIEVSYRSVNPTQARIIVNGFMSEMEYQNLLDKRAKATVLKSFLENQYRNVSLLLENAENQYLDTKLSSGIVSVNEQTTQYIDLLRFLEERRIDYEIRLAEATAAKEKAATILNGDPELKNFSRYSASPFSQDNQILQELYSRVATLQVNNARLNAAYNASHPLVLQSNAELDASKKELDSAISATVINATNGIDPLLRPIVESQLTNHINTNVYEQLLSRIKKEIVNLNRSLEKLPKSEIARARYERNVGINRQIHDLLLTRLEEARIMEASAISDIRVINRAEIPTRPVSPQRARILILALLFGVFVSGTVVFGCEHFKPSFNTVENIERQMGAPVLGLVPRLTLGSSQKRQILVDSTQEGGINFQACEVFNSLLVNFLASSSQLDQKALIITSTFAREGKSMISANLAVTMAKAGKKVLLIDCDLRSPVLHSLFNVTNEFGLVDLIKTGSTKGFFKTDYQNLVFLPAGNVKNVAVAELLHEVSLVESIKQLESRFDLILIDAPPIMLYTDAIVLSSHFKNVLLVIKSGTDESAVLGSRKALKKAGARILGIVVNNIKRSILFGAPYESNGYGYGYGYGHKENRRENVNTAV